MARHVAPTFNRRTEDLRRTLLEDTFVEVVQWPEQCESTSALALASGEARSAVFGCDRQTAGRGRPGKSWDSLPGDLTISLRLPSSSRLPGSSRHSNSSVGVAALRAGLAAALATERVGLRQPRVKWPNDVGVLRGGRFLKFGGVLIESTAGATVVGLGLNVVRRAHKGHRTDLTTELACNDDPFSLRDRIVVEFVRATEALQAVTTSEIVTRVANRDALRGKLIDTCAGRGTAAGIGDCGGLILQRSGGESTLVRSGSVRIIETADG